MRLAKALGWTCAAYEGDRICRAVGVEIDQDRGLVVCEKHRRRGLGREEITNASPDWPLAMAQLAEEETHGQAKAEEGTRQEEKQEAGTATTVLTWRDVYRDGWFAYYELVVFRSLRDRDFNVSIALSPRPTYCDRGHWIAQVAGPLELDWADAFPRYYMDVVRAKAELHDWLLWRLECAERREWPRRDRRA